LLVVLAGLAGATLAAAEPAPAAPVSVQTKRISLGSPFSPSAPCAKANPGFSPGYAQEMSLAVNPRDPRQILVSWIQDGRTTDTVMASRDGGRSFSRVFVPGLSQCTGGEFNAASDPGVEFSADGRTAYFTAIVINLKDPTDPSSATTSMFVHRSFDGGFSWSPPYVIQRDTGEFWDLPRLTAHPRRPKTAYYVYDLREPPDFISGYNVFSTTTDGGRSWSAPQKLYDPQTPDSWPGISKILVNRDGSLLAVAAIVSTPNTKPTTLEEAANPTQQLAIRSVDGGRTWGKPITIGSSSGRRVNDPVTGTPLNTFDTFPSQTVAPNGDVYVSWLQPGATNASSQIAVARSTDGGRRWTTRRLAVRGQAALPSVAVAGDGTVGVMYYAIAASSSAGNWPARVLMATSTDRGRHWSTHRLAGPFNLLTAGSKARPCCFLGDYEGIAGVPNGFAAAFAMAKPIARNAVDAYFARVTTSPTVGIRTRRAAAVSSRGSVRIALSCRRGPGRCRGRLTLDKRIRPSRRVRLATKRFSIRSGKSARIRLELNRSGRRLLARSGRGRLTIRARATTRTNTAAARILLTRR
jgi:hypothetical protein